MNEQNALSLVIFLAILPNVNCKTSFVKDQGMNAVFPPVNTRTNIDIPDGHLRPLGLVFTYFRRVSLYMHKII